MKRKNEERRRKSERDDTSITREGPERITRQKGRNRLP